MVVYPLNKLLCFLCFSFVWLCNRIFLYIITGTDGGGVGGALDAVFVLLLECSVVRGGGNGLHRRLGKLCCIMSHHSRYSFEM